MRTELVSGQDAIGQCTRGDVLDRSSMTDHHHAGRSTATARRKQAGGRSTLGLSLRAADGEAFMLFANVGSSDQRYLFLLLQVEDKLPTHKYLLVHQ